MNKQQIILPLAAILIAVIVVGIIHGRSQSRHYIRVRSEQIGQSLISETNSVLLVKISPNLEGKLRELLCAPARVEAVSLGDEAAPIGDGSASSRLYLVNERQLRITIRLRKDNEQDKFHVLGFWTPSLSPSESQH